MKKISDERTVQNNLFNKFLKEKTPNLIVHIGNTAGVIAFLFFGLFFFRINDGFHGLFKLVVIVCVSALFVFGIHEALCFILKSTFGKFLDFLENNSDLTPDTEQGRMIIHDYYKTEKEKADKKLESLKANADEYFELEKFSIEAKEIMNKVYVPPHV